MVFTAMELIISEGRVYGSRYYTAEPAEHQWDVNPDWSFRKPWKEMEEWCADTFGPSGHIWGEKIPVFHRWYVNNAKFWFKDKKDLEWFMLKWS